MELVLRVPALRRTPPTGSVLVAGGALWSGLGRSFNLIRLGERGLAHKLERMGMRSHRAALGEARVHFWEGGSPDARPVVLLHGFGASAIWQWHGQVKALLRTRRVIVPDLLWFGESWSRRRDFSIDHQLEAIAALLDHRGIESADFVGISYGGILAHELAAAMPHRVGKLALLASPGRAYTSADYAGLLERFRVADVGQLMVPHTPEQVEVLLELGYHRPPKAPRFLRGQVLDAMYSQFREEKAGLLEAMLGHLDQLDQRPGSVAHETLLIWGRQDRVFPLEIGRRLLAEMRGPAKLEVIEGAGHAPNLEHPRRVAELLAGFLG